MFRVKTNIDHELPAVIGSPKRITVDVSYKNEQVHNKNKSIDCDRLVV